METKIGNIAGNFEEIEIICPKCDSKNVNVAADGNGYFRVLECASCGYKSYRTEN